MISQNLLLGSDGYLIQRSLRFRSSASANISRTLTSNGSATKFTWSSWLKRSSISNASNDQWIFGADNYNTSVNALQFEIVYRIAGGGDDDSLAVNMEWPMSGTNAIIKTAARFRDPSAWYHIVVAVDTTQATASNRVNIYINGVLQTSFYTASYPAQNQAISINQSGSVPRIGAMNLNGSATRFFDGYLSEINFIDGQQLTASSFGQFDPVTGVWQPKKYGGTYGQNGFYLPFSDNSSTTTLGYDKSGNSNNWTCNNISLTAGSTYDSMTDVPTLTSATQANYCVLNPLQYSVYSITSANLNVSVSGANSAGAGGTIAVSSGKYYCEFTPIAMAASDVFAIGVREISASIGAGGAWNGGVAGSYIYRADGYKRNNGTSISGYGASYITNDVIGVALDLDGGTVTFYKNGSSQGQAYSGLSGNFQFSIATDQSTGTSSAVANFGQRPFAHTPPTGFLALNTFNLPEPSIKSGNKHFDVLTFDTQSGSYPKTISGLNFQPDFVWAKSRSQAYPHYLFDSVRGTGIKALNSNATSTEGSDATTNLSSFNSNGFTVSAGDGIGYTNGVSWLWKAGGSAVSNTAGSITSQVSANPSAGFSVVTYTGNGTIGATIGHGLGVAPKMMMIKTRSAVNSWVVYHQSLGNTKAIYLNLTGAADTNSSFWNNTSPTSSVFTLGTDTICNQNGTTYVAYCFSEVAGYSKFGGYTGNGSADGPFVHLGFRPRFLMVKSSSPAQDWKLIDTARNTYNSSNSLLGANVSSAEDTNSAYDFDILSNGFKPRNTFGYANSSGATYIYMAFAENPFKHSLAR